MKKIIGLTLMLFLPFSIFVGCASQPPVKTEAQMRQESGRSASPAFPKFVRDAVRTAPSDALVGVGSAKLASLSQSRTFAGARARTDISRQMNSMVTDMINDYQASNELDRTAAISFQENFTQIISKSTLVGSVTAEEDMDANDTYWVVIYLNKASVVNEINQAQAAAKLAVPAAAAFDANRRMDAAFSKALNQEIIGVDR